METKYLFNTCLLIAVFFAQATHASQISIRLGRSLVVNPETAEQSVVVLNPSGTADLSYFQNGFKLSYLNAVGLEESVKIHFDFNQSDFPGVNEGAIEQILNLVQEAKSKGSVIVGAFLKSLNPSNRLQLHLDSGGRSGFLINDFEASHVKFVTPESMITLMAFAYQAIQVRRTRAGAQKTEPEAKPRQYGFDLASQYVTTNSVSPVSCLSLF